MRVPTFAVVKTPPLETTLEALLASTNTSRLFVKTSDSSCPTSRHTFFFQQCEREQNTASTPIQLARTPVILVKATVHEGRHVRDSNVELKQPIRPSCYTAFTTVEFQNDSISKPSTAALLARHTIKTKTAIQMVYIPRTSSLASQRTTKIGIVTPFQKRRLCFLCVLFCAVAEWLLLAEIKTLVTLCIWLLTHKNK
eukprot:TRINITY_DN6254_c0_g1_i1.p1 TRINITY_DN6254_c0_g1~~TRINITY_DN6254_c0_g1_i1.p1  ORF type:complete len:197 (+),score=11.56 TRINITY_DN6254_c0_g1_i1:638-1228(+)